MLIYERSVVLLLGIRCILSYSTDDTVLNDVLAVQVAGISYAGGRALDCSPKIAKTLHPVGKEWLEDARNPRLAYAHVHLAVASLDA